MKCKKKMFPVVAAVGAVAFGIAALSLAACTSSPAKSPGTSSSQASQVSQEAWVAKNENSTVSSGVYRYYLASAYISAVSTHRQDYSKSVFDQEIDGQPAEEWIRAQALEGVKNLLMVNDLMKEYNLTVSTEDALLATQQSDSYWTQVKQIMQSYGITKADAKSAQFDFQVKNTTIFEHLYTNGENKVAEDDLEAYLKQNYTAFRYVLRSTYDDTYTSLPEAELKDLRKQFQDYATAIRNGSMTIEDAAMDLAEKEAEKETSSASSKTTSLKNPDALKEQAEKELQTRILNLSEDADQAQQEARYPEEMLKALHEMKNGEVRTIEAQGYLITVVKDDINTVAEERLADREGRREILIDWKGAEYTQNMQERMKNYQNYQLNDEEFNFDLREYFEPADSSASSSVSSSPLTVSSEG